MKRVLFISHGGRRNGGAQNVLYGLLQDLPRDRFELHCLFPEHGEFANQVKALQIVPHYAPLKWWAGFEIDTIYKITNLFLEMHRSAEHIARLVQQHRIELVVSNTIAMAEGAIAAQLAGVPHIWWVHEILSKDPKLKHFMRLDFLYPYMMSLSKTIVTVSNAARQEFVDHIRRAEADLRMAHGTEKLVPIDLDKIQVVHNGVTIPPPSTRAVNHQVLAVGGICRRKGQHILLEAARFVVDKYPNSYFNIVGSFWETEYRRQLLARRVELGLEKHWAFHKWREDLPHWYQTCSLMVSPSTCESFGLSILEAMSYGLPVISTDCGGPAEVVQDDWTGCLVPMDDPRALADKILYLFENPITATQMGLNGRERARLRFTRDRMAQQFTQILEAA